MISKNHEARVPGWRFLVSLLVLSVTAILIGRRIGFDGLYGQDAFAYFQYASGPFRDALASGQATLPAFSWPIGYPLAVVAMSFVASLETA